MLITKCYIENFGKHSKVDFDFTKGMNSIIQENGWGKSTLAIFIKAMFYGLPASRKSNFDENDRKKYNPWQSGNYGGYIEFQIDDREYRIERYFGKKESDDTFTLIDLRTNKKSTDFDENIGITLFGLDADAYERSTFIPQKILSNSLNESLSAKLTNVIQGTDYVDGYDRAIEIINSRKREVKNNQNRGELSSVEENIYELNHEIQVLKSSTNTITQLEERLIQENDLVSQTERDLENLKAQIKSVASNQELLAKKHIYQDLVNTEREISARIDEINAVLNGKELSRKELDEISTLNNKLDLAKSNLNQLAQNSFLDNKHKELKAYFINGVPTEDQIMDLLQKNEEVKKMELVADSNNTPERITKPINIIMPSIFAIILSLIGIGVLNSMLAVSIVCFAVAGLVVIGIVIYVIMNKKHNQYADTNQVTSIDSVHKLEIREFISKYEKIERTYDVHLYNILKKVGEYSDLTIQMTEIIDKIHLVKTDIQNIEAKINSFFSGFGLDLGMDNAEKINTLRQIIIEQESLLRQKNDNKAKMQSIKNGIDDQCVEDVDITKLQLEEKNILSTLEAQKENRTRTINQINNCRDKISRIPDLENELTTLEERKAELEHEMKMLKLTTEYLDRAKDSLSTKYLSPMKSAFDKYMRMLTGSEQNYLLDTDLNVSVVEFGKARESSYLSRGYQSVVDLCIRFALIDTIFTKEKPFIILDDPFVNMDKDKVSKALTLLHKVSDDYQIIYLACHESRA